MFSFPRPFKWMLPTLVSAGLLAGCGLFRSSEIQQSVEQAHSEGAQNGQPLSAVRMLLAERGIAHKIVRFRYDVAARPLVPPSENPMWSWVQTPLGWLPQRPHIREQSAILYRDEADPSYPWWYVDTRVSRPIWVPTQSTERQLRFAVRRRVEILRLEEFDRALDGMAKDSGNLEEAAQNRWTERFRRVHGSDFNPNSPMDISKMRALKAG